MLRVLNVMLIGCGLLFAANNVLGQDGAHVFRLVEPSVVTVVAGYKSQPMAQGSGVVIAPTEIVTNCHVVLWYPSIRVRQRGESVPAQLVRGRFDWDLCVLAPAAKIGAPAKLATGTYGSTSIGQKIYAVGSPRGLELTISEGIVSSHRTDKSLVPMLQLSAPISHGSSGGGVFDSRGRLVGITTSGVDNAQNLNFAMSVALIELLPKADTSLPIVFRKSRLIAEHMIELDDRGDFETLGNLANALLAEDPTSALGIWFRFWIEHETKRDARLPPPVLQGYGMSIPMTDHAYIMLLDQRANGDDVAASLDQVRAYVRRIDDGYTGAEEWELFYPPAAVIGTSDRTRQLAVAFLDRLKRAPSEAAGCPRLAAAARYAALEGSAKGSTKVEDIRAMLTKMMRDCTNSRLAMKETTWLSLVLGYHDMGSRAGRNLKAISPASFDTLAYRARRSKNFTASALQDVFND